MRIAVIGTRGAESGPDAIEAALNEICPRLIRRGHEIDILSERNGRALAAVPGARMLRLPTLPVAFGEAAAHALLSSLITAGRGYDVVNFCAAEPGGLFSLMAKIGLSRTVVSVHGLDGDGGGGLFGPASVAARFADAITVVSRRLERHFRTAYGRDTVFIPNGIAFPGTPRDPGILQGLGLMPGGYVLAADRMIPESGIELAVRAANAAAGAVHLVVAETGDGDADYRRRLVAAADPGRVMMIGRVAPPLLDALIDHAHLFVLPSLSEEAPPVLLKALAHGRAVVSSDLPGQMDVVGPNAFTFTAGDAGDLHRVLRWLLADPEVVAAMERRAAAATASLYCWDRIADAYERVYESVL